MLSLRNKKLRNKEFKNKKLKIGTMKLKKDLSKKINKFGRNKIKLNKGVLRYKHCKAKSRNRQRSIKLKRVIYLDRFNN